MEKTVNIISLADLRNDVELITDNCGISLTKEPILIKDFSSLQLNSPYFIQEATIILIHNGETRLRLNFNEHTIRTNDILVLTPNNVAEVLDYTADLEANVLLLNFDVIANLPFIQEFANLGDMLIQSPAVHLQADDFEEIFHLYKMIAYHCNKDGLYRSEIAQNLLSTLCYLLLRFYKEGVVIEKSSATRSDILYKEFLNLVFNFFKRERRVQFYADKLNVTPKYFSKVIKEISCKNASDIIDEMVIMGIKATLRCSKQSILQISEEYNFPNSSFFGTYFKKKTGMTPLQFRNL